MADALWILWNLAAVALLVLLNGFFVAAEFAIVKVRHTQIATAPAGPRRAAAQHAIRHLDAYLSACQLGITLASLGLGWIGEPAISDLIIEPALGGRLDEDAAHTLSFVIAFLIITVLHIVVGELAPKTIAIRKAPATALALSLPLRAFRLVFSPLIWLLNGAANFIVRALGLAPVGAMDKEEYSMEELRLLLAQASAGGRAGEVASRAFALHEITVTSIMTPRDRIVHVDAQDAFEANLERVQNATYSRFPLCDGGLDHVIGFVNQRDVFTASRKEPRPSLADLARPLGVVPGSQKASRAFFDLVEKRHALAIVVNEFGTTIGLLTLDDLLEELVGDLPEDYERPGYVRTVAPGHYVADAQVPVRDLEATLRVSFGDARAATLGGYLNQRLGRIPAKGDTLEAAGHVFTVTEAEKNRARTVEIRRA